ncbi:MAG: hypothetical protein ACRELB_16415, partial [Polyangiaceae bacterium]
GSIMDIKFNQTFDIASYGGKYKLFEAKPTSLSYVFSDIPDAGSESGKAMQAKLKLYWEIHMKEFKTKKEHEYKEILAHTEEKVMKTAASKKKEWETLVQEKKKTADEVLHELKTWLDEEVKGADKMIQNALDTFADVVAKNAMMETWKKVVADLAKKYGDEVTKVKVKAAAKIAAHSAIAVGTVAVSTIVTGLGIALTVVTHGAGAAVLVPVALGAAASTLASVAKAGTTIISTGSKLWPNVKKSQDKIAASTNALLAAVQLSNQKALAAEGGKGLTALQKLTWTFQNTAGKRKDLSTAVEEMKMWNKSAVAQLEKDRAFAVGLRKQAADVKKHAEHLPKDKQSEVMKEADSLDKAAESWMSGIGNTETNQINPTDQVLTNAESALGKSDGIEEGALTKIFNDVKALANRDDFKIVTQAAMLTLTATVSLGKGIDKLVKAV